MIGESDVAQTISLDTGRRRQWQAWPPRIQMILAAPMIYAMIAPLAILDLFCEIYQRIVFPLLGQPLIRRGEYIRMDRHRLGYLDPIQKLGCAYCGYANGLLQFAVKIAARTEEVFCPIRHQMGGRFHEPPHHAHFAAYGDEKAFQKLWFKCRESAQHDTERSVLSDLERGWNKWKTARFNFRLPRLPTGWPS